jgi:hypothetical protein
MKFYAVRTCRGQWAVCSDEGVVLTFGSYDEAVRTARGAVSASKPEGCLATRIRLAHHRTTETQRMVEKASVKRECLAWTRAQMAGF